MPDFEFSFPDPPWRPYIEPQTPLITPGNIAQCIMADIRNEVEAIKQHATTFYTGINDPVKSAYFKSLDAAFILRRMLLERDGQ